MVVVSDVQFPLCFEYGEAQIEFVNESVVLVNNCQLPLTRSQMRLLLAIAVREGKVATHRMLLEALYGTHRTWNQPDRKIIDVLVCNIRQTLSCQHPDAAALLRTVWGRGYVFGFPRVQVAPGKPADFPELLYSRWTSIRKSILLDAVRTKRVTLEALLGWYPDLSAEEFAQWQEAAKQFGRSGLRTTYL